MFYQWTQLRTRKHNLIRLFERMQNYQFEMNSDPEMVLQTNVRVLTEEDLDRCISNHLHVWCTEGVKSLYFLLVQEKFVLEHDLVCTTAQNLVLEHDLVRALARLLCLSRNITFDPFGTPYTCWVIFMPPKRRALPIQPHAAIWRQQKTLSVIGVPSAEVIMGSCL